MSNSTTTLDLVQVGQLQKEVTANAMFDAASPSMAFGRRAAGTTGLTWGYYGGSVYNSAGALVQIANSSVALTASATNYVEVTKFGSVSRNTVGFTAGSIPLYSIVCGAAAVTSYTDFRAFQSLSKEANIMGRSQTIAYAASIVPDVNNGDRIIVGQLTGNITVNSPNNGYVGALITFAFQQDGTAGRTITWNGDYKKAADGAAGTNSQRAATSFFCVAANVWVQVGGALNWFNG